VREREIEAYFVKRVREAGGLQRKFVSPGHRGVPDRIVVFDGWVTFVELKAPGKPLRAEQEREHKRLRDKGCATFKIDTKDNVDWYIRCMIERG
jgi:hypothetical protein